MTCFNSIIIKIQIYAFQSKPKKGKMSKIVFFTKFSSLNCIASKRSKVKGFIDQFYCCYKSLIHYFFFESAFDSFLSSALSFAIYFALRCVVRDYSSDQHKTDRELMQNEMAFDEFLVGRSRIFTTRTVTAAISWSLTSIPIESMSWLQFEIIG